MDYFNINNRLSGIYAVANSIRETLKPYAEAIEVFQQNMRGILEAVAEKNKACQSVYYSWRTSIYILEAFKC